MKYIIGAYTTAPSIQLDNKNLERDFYFNLVEAIPDMRGLELPFWGDDIHRYGAEFLFPLMQPEWENILTCIPGTMKSLSQSPVFGLASDDKHGRAAAIAMLKRANVFMHRMNDFMSKQSIIAVQIVTAPSMPTAGVFASVDSFRRSLDEILLWDWSDAKIVVEHCDTYIEGNLFEKGFLPIEDELKVLGQLSAENNIGVAINWARSAIEGRSPDAVIKHLNLAQENNLLTGLIFSGVSSCDERYGSWKDTHMPFACSFDVECCEENSLLTKENVRETLKAIDMDKLDYIGIKLLEMSVDDSTIDRRVGLNRDAISILNKILIS